MDAIVIRIGARAGVTTLRVGRDGARPQSEHAREPKTALLRVARRCATSAILFVNPCDREHVSHIASSSIETTRVVHADRMAQGSLAAAIAAFRKTVVGRQYRGTCAKVRTHQMRFVR